MTQFTSWLDGLGEVRIREVLRTTVPTRSDHMEMLAPQLARRFDTDAYCLHEMPAYMCGYHAANREISQTIPDDYMERTSRFPRDPQGSGFTPIATQQFARSW